MFKLGKLTDYGIVLLTYCAEVPDRAYTARQLSAASDVPLPTVSKVLKTLCRGGLLVSTRGTTGGYRLARPAREISVAEIIAAIEGPIALTDCSSSEPTLCQIEAQCPTRGNWTRINAAVIESLQRLTLADMEMPQPKSSHQPQLVQLSVRSTTP